MLPGSCTCFTETCPKSNPDSHAQEIMSQLVRVSSTEQVSSASLCASQASPTETFSASLVSTAISQPSSPTVVTHTVSVTSSASQAQAPAYLTSAQLNLEHARMCRLLPSHQPCLKYLLLGLFRRTSVGFLVTVIQQSKIAKVLFFSCFTLGHWKRNCSSHR